VRIKRLRQPVIILLKILLSSRIKLSELKHQPQHIRPRSIVLQQSHTITRKVSPVLLLPQQQQQLQRPIQLRSIVLRPNPIITRSLLLAPLPRPLP